MGTTSYRQTNLCGIALKKPDLIIAVSTCTELIVWIGETMDLTQNRNTQIILPTYLAFNM